MRPRAEVSCPLRCRRSRGEPIEPSLSDLVADPRRESRLQTRADIQRLLTRLWEPLRSRFSPGRALLTLGHTGAHFPFRGAELEAFTRPLWGLAPLAHGGGGFPHWALYREGLIHGTDPRHPEYWGRAGDFGHELVEMPPIALALCLAREHLWDPLAETERARLGAWLRRINEVEIPDNNWLFFRVLVNVGLLSAGFEADRGGWRTPSGG
jgi:hypothetical protein